MSSNSKKVWKDNLDHFVTNIQENIDKTVSKEVIIANEQTNKLLCELEELNKKQQDQQNGIIDQEDLIKKRKQFLNMKENMSEKIKNIETHVDRLEKMYDDLINYQKKVKKSKK
ncbi:uncharacterized protein SCDLUD_004177 [Saccharomycodes ludwigii]|uniref:uncharacterized protein n=1 Tax=Saccharomycodes ludwigii TaxID=36035 RepID=UPI001E886316|nr:hypothetical protein SCDLUD_004177 [Saccharomycodes ludwigii]KAH3899877.1 hypothetical protein SCDLUD_004177 [Saccharomycodes ludwigii]